MVIERKIVINNRNYYLGIKLKYKKDEILVKEDETYFDMGDLSIMIDYVQDNYDKNIIYDSVISYMNDIIYLYDRFPFISYIKDITYNDKGIITCIGNIEKDEFIKYINDNNIKLDRWDKKDIPCPLLYK